jgi:hypothetical protein
VKPTVAALLALLVFAGIALAPPARADEATDKARSRYETGLELFYAREHAQALIEFQRAHELKPRPATLFMMAQCEYLLGSLRVARDHYDAYLRESPAGEFVEVAKDRIEAINRRPATLVINTAPDQVDVRLTPVVTASPSPDAAPAIRTVVPISGQAPNNFSVPRGRWLVSVSKVNYLSQRAEVELDVADSKHLFFKLDPIPARLDIETVPAGATLYVNGNRARNPYHQDVAPGRFEIFAEATDYKDRTDEFVLGPGDRRSFEGLHAFQLEYVQRSGRPELLAASSILGGLVGAGAVAAALGDDATDPLVSTAGLFVGGALAGTLTGGLIANRVVPSYIPDNRALFILGGMWVGAAEGALTGMIIRQSQAKSVMDDELGTYRQVPTDLSSAAFLGSLPGLAVGATTGALLSRRAPTYGRVALIQSATIGGGIAGMLSAAALQWNPFGWQRRVQTLDIDGNPKMPKSYHLDSDRDPSLPALIGLNVGLGVGLLGAYLPDQSRYGPTWKRIGLIDLATVAGLFAGGIAGCVSAKDCVGAITADSSAARARSSAAALLGGTMGALAGILLTRDVDRDLPPQNNGGSVPPTITLFPVRDVGGGTTPAVGAVGFF